MTLGTARVIRGNALALPLEDESVDLIVTSPPYFGLRSYQDGGTHYDGQIGAEATPTEFVDALIAATSEMIRVTKPTGSIWVNLGDKYSQRPGQFPSGNAGGALTNSDDPDYSEARRSRAYTGMQPKSLIGIPWRYALRAIDDLGLILRAEIIWSKSNGLPESVTDRVRRSHEVWFHFVKLPRYYSAVDEIREPHTWQPSPGYRGHAAPREVLGQPTHFGTTAGAPGTQNPLGKLPGSVWTISTQPLTVPDHLGIDHYAAFPIEWPRRIIAGWSPPGICTACGQGRRPVATPTGRIVSSSGAALLGGNGERYGGRTDSNAPIRTATGWQLPKAERVLTGYACACPDTTAPTTPAVILDPFGGTGTTALAAKAAGRTGITIDMSADYCRLATWRTNDPGQLAAALQVDKPAPVAPDQLDLLEGLLA
jgi:DNA modification methylase